MARVAVSKTVTRTEPTTIPIVEAEVKNVMFQIERNRAILDIYLYDDLGNVRDREVWMMRGTALNNALSRAPQGSSTLVALLNNINYIINEVENTPGRKEQLKENGQLQIYSSLSFKLNVTRG